MFLDNEENVIPDFFYTLHFNYVYKEENNFATPYAGRFQRVTRYSFYNKRHRSVGTLTLQASPTSETEIEYAGNLMLTPWAWDYDPWIRGNRLGLVRPEYYKYVDYNLGSCELLFEHNEHGWYALRQSTAIYDEWNDFGRKVMSRKLIRYTDKLDSAGGFNSWVNYLKNSAETRVINDNDPIFPENTENIDFRNNVLGLKLTQVYKYTYEELSAIAHTVTEIHLASSSDNKNTYQIKTTRIQAPIPKIQRVQVLDVGKWSIINLAGNPAATCARYNGIVFNNTYLNLNNAPDVGFQQILAAVDSDYVYLWGKANSGNFNDIRTLKNVLFNYIPVLATLVSKKLKIRFSYVNYVIAVITKAETLRGLTSSWHKPYNVHTYYPWLADIESTYEDYLQNIFELIEVDLSSNDAASVLLDTYKREIVPFNKWSLGETTAANINIAKLGVTHKQNINTYLIKYREFVERFLWADVDKALTDAYLNDMSFAGNIKINDPAAVVRPGDSVELNFLDDELIALKVMGANIDVSSKMLNYNIEVKRQW